VSDLCAKIQRIYENAKKVGFYFAFYALICNFAKYSIKQKPIIKVYEEENQV